MKYSNYQLHWVILLILCPADQGHVSKFSPGRDVLFSSEGSIFSALLAASALKYVSLQRARAARDETFCLVGHVSELTVYPIKGCMGVDLQSALATDVGLSAGGYYDRRWMIQSKESGTFFNMKDHPRLTLVTCTVDGDWLVVSTPEMTPLRLPRHPDPAKFQHVTVVVRKTTIRALDAGREASDWMTRFLRQPVNLLHSGPGIGTRDSYDLIWDFETSSRRGDKTVFAMVDNSIAFDEDNWEEIRIGSSAKFHYIQPCRRCVITTVDPNTAEHNKANQPLATLRKYRQKAPYGASPLFGAYIALDSQGPIRIGDPVYAIRRQSTPS
ncbi:hypothetical protein ACOMHN_007891 [Nucella lapillus]